MSQALTKLVVPVVLSDNASLLQAQNRGDSEKYNNIIAHETLRVAVCGALESSQGPPGLQ